MDRAMSGCIGSRPVSQAGKLALKDWRRWTLQYPGEISSHEGLLFFFFYDRNLCSISPKIGLGTSTWSL
jgi:hypothetical protein